MTPPPGRPPSVAVIGAGFAGLSAAVHLGAAGADVTLFEQNGAAGGKASERRFSGFRFDTGPSIVTMPYVLEDLARAGGTTLDRLVTLVRAEPVCRYFYPSGHVVDASHDVAAFASSLAAVDPRDGAALAPYLSRCERLFGSTAPVFLHSPLFERDTFFSKEAWRLLPRLPTLDALRTVHDANASYFRSAEARQLFDRYATYNGSDPFKAPATLNVIPWVEYGLGCYYPRGGIYRLVEAALGLVAATGGKVVFGTKVERLLLGRAGAVRGVRVAGEDLPFDAVVCAFDAETAYRTLVDPPPRRRAAPRSTSGVVFLWGVTGRTEGLAHHDVLFSADYGREFASLSSGVFPEADPTVYLAVTSLSDPDHAPPGCENWFVLVNVPPLGDDGTGVDEERVKDAVLRKVARSPLGDVSGRIVAAETLGPVYLRDATGASGGSIYGPSSDRLVSAFLRQPNRSRRYPGLYFAGGTAHPGGGIPLVVLSGRTAAGLAATRLGLRVPPLAASP